MISFIGMRTQELEIKPTMSVVLKSDTEVLDEVMVVAYGSAKKSSFTGSASVMKAGEMSAPKQSLVKSLEGKVAGVLSPFKIAVVRSGIFVLLSIRICMCSKHH